MLSCPLSPQPPSPAGKGETFSLFRRGLRPRHPGIKPPAALVRPAVSAPSGAGAVSCRACFACRINAFLPPIPPTPFPGGEGGDQSYFMQGASPLASPALDRLRHLFALPLWKTQWWLSPGGTGYPCRCGARGGACLFGCLSPLPLALFLPPIPPAPFPGGEGGDQSYFMQGAPPLASPRLSPGGTYRTCQAGARSGALPLARRGWRSDTRRERGS